MDTYDEKLYISSKEKYALITTKYEIFLFTLNTPYNQMQLPKQMFDSQELKVLNISFDKNDENLFVILNNLFCVI